MSPIGGTIVPKITFDIGDSEEKLKAVPDNSIDLIASDPPYQLDSTRVYAKTTPKEEISENLKEQVKNNTAYGSLIRGFMGEEWDVLPTVGLLKECLRVLKPGAFSFWLMTPRQDSQAEFINRLRTAGFVVSFSPIFWAYASGFPKAASISKLIDKRLGVAPEVAGVDENFLRRNPANPHKDDYQETVGEPSFKDGVEGAVRTLPTSPEAKKMAGGYAGFQPKPAVEVVIVAMKPLETTTYVEQALANGKGVTWLDSCRIPYASESDKLDFDGMKRVPNQIYGGGAGTNLKINPASDKGRFPANLLVCDDVLNDGNITKSSGVGGRPTAGVSTEGYGFKPQGGAAPSIPTDEGSFSRFFDLDRWWEEGVKRLPPDVQRTFPFFIVPKPTPEEKNDGCEGLGLPEKSRQQDGDPANWDLSAGKVRARMVTQPKPNHHPTVKPLKLMSYLIQLGSREGDTVLDPFLGSGTTLVSCKLLNRNGIGFERDEKWRAVIQGRLDAVKTAPTLDWFGGD